MGGKVAGPRPKTYCLGFVYKDNTFWPAGAWGCPNGVGPDTKEPKTDPIERNRLGYSGDDYYRDLGTGGYTHQRPKRDTDPCHRDCWPPRPCATRRKMICTGM
jgi:hypothetical protein